MDIWQKAKDVIEGLFDQECMVSEFQSDKTQWGETQSGFGEQRIIKCHLMESPKALEKNGYIFETEVSAIMIYSADERILAGSQLEFHAEDEQKRIFIASGDEVIYKTHKEIRVTAKGSR